MRVGLFGGSFDPIHWGHIRPVEAARQAARLDRVVFLPTARPPHKRERRFAPPWARYAMVELALLDRPHLEVSPFEMTLDRPAFTIDSLEHFRRELPGAELALLLGADAFHELPTWRRWQEIPELAELVVLARPGWDEARLRAGLHPLLAAAWEAGRALLVPNRPERVSATGLRERLGRGDDVPAAVLPALVLEYVRKYSLYR